MWTFVGRRKRKVWLWLAVERASRRIVAWVLGCRGAATARRLWAALPRRYQRHCRYHPDQWEAYAKVLPATTGPGPKAVATQVSSRRLIVRCATGAACWCASLARLAKAWRCIPPALKLSLTITISP